MTLIERCLDKIEIQNGCWFWTAALDRGGYARLNDWPKTYQAHKWLYEYFYNISTTNLDHLCRNRSCVNPLHLESVTNKVNILRGIGITAVNARKTQCPHGHAYTPENTDIQHFSYGVGRSCKTCRRIRQRVHA